MKMTSLVGWKRRGWWRRSDDVVGNVGEDGSKESAAETTVRDTA